MEKEEKIKEENLVHDFNKNTVKSLLTPKVITLFLIVVVAGVLSGFFIAGKGVGVSGSKSSGVFTNSSTATKGTVVGANDTSTFKDTAEGTLKEGGVNGEGAYHLERTGGESQNVYLTSSTVDLSKFIDKKIKVWGQTQKAQYAGWLMDVGKIEVL